MTKPFVAILMGSDSDFPVMQLTTQVLAEFEIAFEMRVLSAHRTPSQTMAYVKEAQERGCEVFICAAGLAAHLAGTVAAHTIKPVIGVPLEGGSLQGMDSLLSTVQMPAGIPVGTVAIGKAGAQNAAFFSAQILALKDATLAARLQKQRVENAKKIAAKDEALQEKLKMAHV
ncbi:MAG: 5-(carboxyamino)imidazole ribonucleotide mutase [Proteobacteria bacterium]|nr:5-(carboxyamino)imidazole ribonucleotide mutase [Pseudomonadota bacterium]